MNYKVVIEDSTGASNLSAVRALTPILGKTSQEVRLLLSDGQTVLDNATRADAEQVGKILENHGFVIDIVPNEAQHASRVQAVTGNQDRDSLFELQQKYILKDRLMSTVRQKKTQLNKLNTEINKLKESIKIHTNRVQSSNVSVYDSKFSLDVNSCKITFIASAIISMFISGYLYSTNDISIIKSYFILLIVSAILSLVPSIIKYKKQKSSDSRNNNMLLYSSQKFMSEIHVHKASLAEKEKKAANLKNEIAQEEIEVSGQIVIDNSIPLPEDLRTIEGIDLLLNYFDTGRVKTHQEAVNLYYQQLDDIERKRNDELRTEYARIQAEKAEEALEVARENLKATQRMEKEAERAADAAATAASYERQRYWEEMYERAQRK